jgi:hypothetical protein
MSKEAALRAMREARYKERSAPAPSPTPAPTPAPAPAQTPAPPSEALCGHRSMNGRTCTREQGHTAKNHRYS